MKTIRLTIKDKNNSILASLREAGYELPAWCGGRGSCGKCGVRFISDAPPPCAGDRERFSDEEISAGWRLSCLTHAAGTFVLEIPESGEEMSRCSLPGDREDVSRKEDSQSGSKGQGILSGADRSHELALAVDLGTTTIAAALVEARQEPGQGPKILRTATTINRQRVYGADVLSRIDAANRGEGEKLKELAMEDISRLCRQLGCGSDVRDLAIPVIISANTTMGHLLQGLSCEKLGVYPYEPVDLSLHQYGGMTILPGISTYVGADIVSGIIACGIDRKEELSLLLDLGTNGEMVIGSRDGILAASAAAGPAFEGGNISCGVAGVPGAIDGVTIRDGKALISTIAAKPPIGLCGTGVLETVYELVREGIADRTGLMRQPWFEEGFPLAQDITFTAKDIREVQMAKAAIRAGIEILTESYGVSYDQIDRLYLAGGFGKKINCRKAVGIGMLPEELADRVTAVGNSSLMGAAMFAADPAVRERMDRVTKISREISLSNHRRFEDLYIDYMSL